MATISNVSGTALAQSVRIRTTLSQSEWSEIHTSLGGSALQSWFWGEFKSRHGWQPFRVAVFENGEPALAAQVLKRQVGPMSVLYVPRGPILGTENPQSWSALTLAVDRLARQERAAICFLEPDEYPSVPLPESGDLSWTLTATELQPLRTIKVRVDRDDEELLSGMKSKTRYNVRLAGRRGVTVRHATPSEVAPFYELLQETSDRDEFGIHSIEYYADMLDVFRDSGALLLAEHEGEIAAGAIVLQNGEEAIYMFGASSREHQRHMPTHLLQFEAMRWARDRGCTHYDLWGIPPTDTPPEEAGDGDLNVRSGLWGVYRFKQGFGGEVVSYPGVYERVYYPRLVSIWRHFRPGLGA